MANSPHTGTPPQVDRSEIRRTVEVLQPTNAVVEVRILTGTRATGTLSGYFTDPAQLVQAAARWSGKAPVYVTLNACDRALLARSAHRLTERAAHTTADHDILSRQWLPLDFDPARPAGISSTDGEHAAALARMRACHAWLQSRGWPPAIEADSGNGAHLLPHIDLPNDDTSRALVQRCLEALAFYFSDDVVGLDLTTYNAARIWKCYGTLACKGDNLPDRPHRLARLLAVPSPILLVSREQLEALAALAPQPSPGTGRPRGGHGDGFDLAHWIAAHELPVVAEGPWQRGGYRWILNPCPWNADHTNRAAYIVQHANGAIAAGCHHNGCHGRDWYALRDVVEPGWRNGQPRDSQPSSGSAPADENAPPTAPPTEPAEPFPVEILPAPLERLILEGAAALPCPPDFIAVPMLAVLGTAIGTSVVLEIKPGWREGPRIYGGVVADPGSKKSPALDLAVAPVYEQQKAYQCAYDEACRQHEAALAQYEIDHDDWRKAVRAGKASAHQRPVAPEEPMMTQMWTSDSTLEALAELLERNPRGVLFVRDELSGWALAMNQYRQGHGADRQAWLSYWNGAPVIINRKARKQPINLTNPFVCVAGCLPPDVLSDLADERGREDGFIHRILFALPDPLSLEWTETTLSDEAVKGYDQVVQALLSLPRHASGPRVVTFTPKGRDAFIAFTQELYADMNRPDFPAHLRGPWAKLQGYGARLALILQLARQAAGETERESVEEASVLGAAALVYYFRAHARRVYARLRTTPDDRKAELAVAWIQAHGGTVTAREVLSYKVAGVKTASEAKALLQQLEDRGYGKCHEEDHHRITFTLH